MALPAGLNLVLLFVGGLVEIYAAIIVVVPLLVPLGVAFGLDPIHLGIIFLANMELGFLCPPVGLNLLLSSYRFNKPMAEVTRATLPDAAGAAGRRAVDHLFPAAHDLPAGPLQVRKRVNRRFVHSSFRCLRYLTFRMGLSA